MLFKLIKNELIKLLKKPKTKVMIVLYILFTMIVAFAMHKSAQSAARYSSPEKRVEMLENEKEQIKNDENYYGKGLNNLTEEDKKGMEEARQSRIKQIEDEIAKYKDAIKNGEDPNAWKETTKIRIQENKRILSQNGMDARYKNELEQQNIQLQYYLDNNVKPEEGYEFNAINFIAQYIEILGAVFLLVALAVFSSDIVSGEYTPATMKFLIVQPVKRGKVLLSKFIAVIITTVVLIIGIELISFVLIGLISGFGNLNLPIASGTKYAIDNTSIQNGSYALKVIQGTTKMVPKIQILIQSLGIQALFIIATVAFVFMISTIVSSSMISMAISVIVLIIFPILIQAIRSVAKFAQLLFISYGRAQSLLSGSLASEYRNINFTVSTGIITLIVSTLVFYIIAHINFSKKDLTI